MTVRDLLELFYMAGDEIHTSVVAAIHRWSNEDAILSEMRSSHFPALRSKLSKPEILAQHDTWSIEAFTTLWLAPNHRLRWVSEITLAGIATEQNTGIKSGRECMVTDSGGSVWSNRNRTELGPVVVPEERLFYPSVFLSACHFEIGNELRMLGRPARRVRALPRASPSIADHLSRLGEEFWMIVDLETGFLLRLSTVMQHTEIAVLEVTKLSFEDTDPELFALRPPDEAL